jgi:hypothetical protein
MEKIKNLEKEYTILHHFSYLEREDPFFIEKNYRVDFLVRTIDKEIPLGSEYEIRYHNRDIFIGGGSNLKESELRELIKEDVLLMKERGYKNVRLESKDNKIPKLYLVK